MPNGWSFNWEIMATREWAGLEIRCVAHRRTLFNDFGTRRVSAPIGESSSLHVAPWRDVLLWHPDNAADDSSRFYESGL